MYVYKLYVGVNNRRWPVRSSNSPMRASSLLKSKWRRVIPELNQLCVLKTSHGSLHPVGHMTSFPPLSLARLDVRVGSGCSPTPIVIKPISNYFRPLSITDNEISSEADAEMEEIDMEGNEVTMTTANSNADNSSSVTARKYNLNLQWQNTFPWLIFKDNLMYCQEKNKEAGNSPFPPLPIYYRQC